MDSKLVTNPSLIDPKLSEGLRFHQTGKLNEAEAAYRSVLSKNPGDPDALHLLGVLTAQESNTEAGISLIKQAIQKRPKFAKAFFNLGRIFHENGNFQDAIFAYTKAAYLH